MPSTYGATMTVFGCVSMNGCWRSVTSLCSESVYSVEVMSLRFNR